MCCKNKQQSRTAQLERADPRLRHLQTGSRHRDPASEAQAAPTGPGAFDVTRAALRPIAESPPPAYAAIEASSGPYNAVTIKHTAPRPLHNAAEAIEGGGRIERAMDNDVCSRLGHKACLSHEISPAAHKQAKRRYGKAGVIGGIVFFPWGLLWTACDSTIVCTRCKTVIRGRKFEEKRMARAVLEQARLVQV